MKLKPQLAAKDGLNQRASFRRAARSKFHQRKIGTRSGRYLACIFLQDGKLRACGIVLGCLGYFFKQARAFRVIEKFGGKPFRDLRSAPGEHLPQWDCQVLLAF